VAPIRDLPLQQLVSLSQGQLPQAVVDDLVVQAVRSSTWHPRPACAATPPAPQYTVSKHGIIGLTRSAAFMYGREGIRVNAVAPGGVATGIPMPEAMSDYGGSRLGPFLNFIPPVATAEHLAASISFLLSDDAVNINGAILPSDGGWSIQ
jgi:NAD(P)-dependent dehydrogenase (short-subunit alcohol dehydrogenase family)